MPVKGGAAATAARTSLKSEGKAAGELRIVRPSELAKSGITGIVASGTYEGAKPNKFNPATNDYFVRGTDNTLYILNATKSLTEQLSQLNADTATDIEVVYNGKKQTKNGKGFHDFEVFVING